MTSQIHPRPRLPLAVAFGLAAVALAPAASAQLISFDQVYVDDSYTQGAGVLGSAGTFWNEFSNDNSASNQSLIDETGAVSAVTVSYIHNHTLANLGPTGQFAKLGIGAVGTGPVTIGGLAPGLAYDLVIYAAWDGIPSFTVGVVTETLPGYTTDWSVLTEGVNYLQFRPRASVDGTVTFTSNANPTAGIPLTAWSAFQIQPAAVPEPAEYVCVFGLLSLGAGAWLRRRQSSAA